MGRFFEFKPSRQYGKYRKNSCHKDRKNWVTSRNGQNLNKLSEKGGAHSSLPFILPQIYLIMADVQKTKRRVGIHIIYIWGREGEECLVVDGVIGVFGAAKDGLKG